MTDIVERLRAWGPMVSSGYECPAAGTAMHEAAAEIERLNRELDDVWDALAIQREDNVSFGDAFKRMTSEIERLRDVMKTAIRQFEDGNRLSCHRTLCDEVYGRQT